MRMSSSLAWTVDEKARSRTPIRYVELPSDMDLLTDDKTGSYHFNSKPILECPLCRPIVLTAAMTGRTLLNRERRSTSLSSPRSNSVVKEDNPQVDDSNLSESPKEKPLKSILKKSSSSSPCESIRPFRTSRSRRLVLQRPLKPEKDLSDFMELCDQVERDIINVQEKLNATSISNYSKKSSHKEINNKKIGKNRVPDVFKDDMMYRRMRDSNTSCTSKIDDGKSVKFSGNTLNHYVWIHPNPEKYRSRFLPMRTPDVIGDDLAFRKHRSKSDIQMELDNKSNSRSKHTNRTF